MTPEQALQLVRQQLRGCPVSLDQHTVNIQAVVVLAQALDLDVAEILGVQQEAQEIPAPDLAVNRPARRRAARAAKKTTPKAKAAPGVPRPKATKPAAKPSTNGASTPTPEPAAA